MPNFYHKGVNSLRSQFGLLVVVRLIRNFGYPNILLKKYLPFHAVQYTNLPCFSCLYLWWFTRIEEFFAVQESCAAYTFHYTLVFYWC